MTQKTNNETNIDAVDTTATVSGAKNYVFISDKGGVGKTTISYHCATAVLADANMDFNLVEIDDCNNTASIYESSATLKNRCQSVSSAKGSDALFGALFDSMQSGKSTIIDIAGGVTSHSAIKMIQNQLDMSKTIFVIPFMPSRLQTQNAISTYNLVKTNSVVFCKNDSSTESDFTFWDGSPEDGIESVDEEMLSQKTIFIPRTRLFDIASMSGEVIADLAKYADFFSSFEDAQREIFKLANGDLVKFKKLFTRYNLAKEISEFIKSDLEGLRTVMLGK